jgi:negative regulator of replication initiation
MPKNRKSKSKTPQNVKNEMPENFRSLIVDFTNDLSTTFPEYADLWKVWNDPELPNEELEKLFDYFVKVYPERFFDILYQNVDLFKPETESNTFFLPNVDFKILFNCENVSENTRKAIWKYLQIILFTIVNSVKDKSKFGETMNLFDGVDESELQGKLKETFESIGSFFTNMNSEGEETSEDQGGDENKHTFHFDKMGDMPNPEDLHGHLKGLFDGKIGSLAKEMAEEIQKDFSDILDGDEDINSTQDVLKKILKNPKKIMDLMKTVGNKLNSKMQSGEISQDEIMKEASEWMSKMKDMGGSDQFNEIFKNITKNMGGLGKNMKFDTNAFNRMSKQQTTRERMLRKLEVRKQERAATKLENQIHPTDIPNNYVFKTDDGEQQEKSSRINNTTDLDEFVKQLNITNDDVVVNDPKNKKKKKKNK